MPQNTFIRWALPEPAGELILGMKGLIQEKGDNDDAASVAAANRYTRSLPEQHVIASETRITQQAFNSALLRFVLNVLFVSVS